MNILLITSEVGYDGGGMSLSCSRICNILSKDNTVKIVLSGQYPVATADGGYSPENTHGIRCEYKLKQDCSDYQDADLVIGFGGKFNGYYSALLSERLGVPYILCLRGTDVNIAKWSYKDNWYLKEACSRASKIVCLSNEMVYNVSSSCPNVTDKCVIIPNELEKIDVDVRLANLPLSVIIGSAASHLNEKKGIANLLYMIKEYKSLSDIPIMLQLVGAIDDDLKEEYIKIIDSLNIRQNVEFLGYQPREVLYDTMKRWDFYVQASVCEGHPNSIPDSLRAGIGFISSKTGFIAEVLEEKYPILFFDSWNPAIMANNLLKLIHTPQLLEVYPKVYQELLSYCSETKISNVWKALVNQPFTSQVPPSIENLLCVGLHDIQGDIHDSITTPTEVFENFVRFVKENGYGLCSMKDYLHKSKEERRRWIICTFDDGYMNLADIALPILSKYSFNATVFVCTSLIGKDNSWNFKDSKLRKHLDQTGINRLIEAKWEIGSHGVTHRNLLKLTDVELEEELSCSKESIDCLVGNTISYAYPYGAYNPYIQSQVAKYYKYAFAVSQGGTSIVADSLQLKRYSITEIYQMIESAK